MQEAVHGVTVEECQTALQTHSWNFQEAVKYLKVSVCFISDTKEREVLMDDERSLKQLHR